MQKRWAGEVVRVYAPKVYPPIRISAPLKTLLFTVAGFTLAISAWGIVTLRSAGNQPDRFVAAPLDWTGVRSTAFLYSEGSGIHLAVHGPGPEAAPRRLASFESAADIPARGAASPMADRVAVVHPVSQTEAHLSIVNTADGAITTSPLTVDANATVAWARDGASLVVARSTAPDSSGRLTATLSLVDATTGATSGIATFEDVFRAVPVGFSLNGNRLFVVLIDPAGSTLWAIENGEPALVGTLSSGRTRDWALSPDGTMLAYIDVRSGDPVPSVGRTVFTATSAPIRVSDSSTPQEGVSWRPGATVPGFGGPGGTLQLESSNGSAASYIIPEAWSPDGTRLIARVVKPSETAETSEVTWELLVAPGVHPAAAPIEIPSRSVIYEGPAEVTFLGWVRNAPANPAAVQE